MMPIPFLDKLRAGFLHLALSVAVAAAAAALVFLVWYPPPLARLQAVDRLLVLIVSVDVMLGPLLTAVVYRRGKPRLWLDLGVIAALQIAALGYGLHTVYAARPALIVFNVDRFDTVAPRDLDPASLARARATGRAGVPHWRPEWRVARMPRDPAERSALVLATVSGGADLPLLPHLQVPLAEGRADVLAALRPLPRLRATAGLDADRWAALRSRIGRPDETVGWLPLVARAGEAAVIIDRRSGDVLRIEPMSVY